MHKHAVWILTISLVLALFLCLGLPRDVLAADPRPTIGGRLLDSHGEPVYHAQVSVWDGNDLIGEAESNADGSFLVILERVPQRELRVHIRRPHFHDWEWIGDSHALRQLQGSGGESGYLFIPDVQMQRRVTIGFWVAVSTFVGLLILIALEKLHNTLSALLGMAVIFLVSYIGAPINSDFFILDFERALQYINFEVFFLVLGMMIVISVVEGTGIFQWLSYWAYRIAQGRVWLLSIVLMSLTGLASALLDNVTTMLLMTPISLQIALALQLNPLALLIPEVLASNVGGIATMVGTPTNILIGSYANLSFSDFLRNLTPGVLLSHVVLIAYVQIVFRKEYRSVGTALSATLEEKLAENARITRPVELRKAGVVFIGMLVLFVLGNEFILDRPSRR